MSLRNLSPGCSDTLVARRQTGDDLSPIGLELLKRYEGIVSRRPSGGWTLKDAERRKEAVSRWLRGVVRDETVSLLPCGDESLDLKNILNLLRSNRLREASHLASEAGFLR